MSLLKDLIACPKVEAHNHLNLGMRYSSYVKWAGFYIPNFPRRLKGLDEMHEAVIIPYTRPRVKTYEDVESVFSLSIESAIQDNVKILEGSCDIQFVEQCGGVDKFTSLVQKLSARYSDKIDFRPEIGVGKTFDREKIKMWLDLLLDSNTFKSIDLYGPEVENRLDFFVPYYKKAENLGIKKKAHVGEFSEASSIVRMVNLLGLDEVQHGDTCVFSKDVIKFLAQNKIRCNLCPESNFVLGAVKSIKDHPIRQMVEEGISVTVNTDDLLLFNRSISEQCMDLVENGLFSAEEMIKILKDSYEKSL